MVTGLLWLVGCSVCSLRSVFQLRLAARAASGCAVVESVTFGDPSYLTKALDGLATKPTQMITFWRLFLTLSKYFSVWLHTEVVCFPRKPWLLTHRPPAFELVFHFWASSSCLERPEFSVDFRAWRPSHNS